LTEELAKPPVDDEARMTFTEHLAELRIRIIRSAIALVICVVVAYFFSGQIFLIVARPLMPDALPDFFTHMLESTGASMESNTEWQAFNILEPILVRLKLAGIAGTLFALPFIVYQICAFVFPGLKPNEKKAVGILLGGGAVLAVVGVAVAYFAVFPFVLPYLSSWAPEGVKLGLRMDENVNIILKGMLGFAIAFQFPMAVLILVYLDLLKPETLINYRKITIVALSVVAAVFTPPDPITMILMFVPLLLLYQGSIWLSYIVVRA